MAIHIRNRPSDADRYRVVDLKIIGVDYNALTNRTTISIDPNDTNHDSVEPGYYMIPQRNDDSPNQIVHPLLALEIVGTTKTSSSRALIVNGNQLSKSDDSPGNGFFQHNSPALTTAGLDSPYRTGAFNTSNIQRNRKYRIVTVGNTEWQKFGDLYKPSAATEAGKQKAAVGVTFSANASGSGGDSPQIPRFDSPRVGAGGTRFHDSPEANYKIFGLTGDLAQVNGVYDFVSSSLWDHTSQDIVIEKRTNRGTGRWTIYNPVTQEIFFEDTRANSETDRLDSPYLDSPQVSFEDRTASVSADDQGTGTVVEVGWFSNVITDQLPLTNNELDNNFLSLENTKLARDGSMPITGNQKVFGKVTADNLDIDTSGLISLEGSLPTGTNTFLNAGTKDIECNDLILTGSINDATLFRKYYITSFPHSFLGYYNTRHSYIEPTTALYFADVAPFTVSSTLRSASNGKQFYVRRKNTEFNYILVSEITSKDNFRVGDTVDGVAAAGGILKVLEPKDYIAANQNLKIFGLQQRNETGYVNSIGAVTMAAPSDTFSVERVKQTSTTGTTTYTYRIAHMDSRTGKISNLTTANTDDHQVQSQVAPNLMNNQNYNRLTGVSRDNDNNLILLYRQLNGSGNFDLIDIYGDDELGGSTTNITLEDYGLYNKTEYGSYSGTNGKYNQRFNPTYIPLTAAEREETVAISRTDTIGIPPVGNSNKYSKGFLETTVAAEGVIRTSSTTAANSPSYFNIQETRYDDSPNIDITGFDSPSKVGQQQDSSEAGTEQAQKNNEIEFFIDNARVLDSSGQNIIGGFQKLIQDSIASGLNKVELSGGTYYTKLITLPSNFKLEGNSRTNTFLKSLPWNFTNTSNFRGGRKYTSYTDSPKTEVSYFSETVAGSINTAGNINRFGSLGREGTSSGVFNKIIRGEEAYSKVIIDMDGKENVQLSSITIDGSIESNITEKNSTTGKGNNLVTAERANNVFINDTTIRNSVQSGIFAEMTESLSINNVIVRDGGNKISTSTFATGLYAPEAKQLRMQSSLIENFSNANDLTTNSNTSLVGNIIRNTGSGVLAFASSNINKAANLILGPADEFIPMVDTLNSEYDELNINLLEGGDYLSDIVEFRRDGVALDLGRPEGVNDFGTNFSSTIQTLVELGTSQYFLNDSNFDFTNASPSSVVPVFSVPTQNSPSISDPSAAALSSGNFQLKITDSSRKRLSQVANFGLLQTNYNALQTRPVGENLVGLIFQVFGTQYTFLDGNDTIIAVKGNVVVGTDKSTVTFGVGAKFAGLISAGDKIIFKIAAGETGLSASGLSSISYVTSGTDLLSNPKVLGYNVSSVTTTSNTTSIVIDIPTAQQSSISAGTYAVTDETGGVRLGIRNTFVLSKGRIIV